MVWFRVDDTLAAHQKARRAGLPAMGLWGVAGSWSSQQLSDGYIPSWYVETWPGGKKLAASLVGAGLWHTRGHGCDRCPQPENGWQFHDWTDRNPTRVEVEKEREAAKERMKRAREKRKSSTEHNGEVQANVQANERRSSPPRSPTPTRPVPKGRSWSGEEPPVTEVDARDSNEGGTAPPNPDADPLTRLVAEVQAIRPTWTPDAIRVAARRCTDAGRTPADTRHALLDVAARPDSTAAGRVVHDGPWWPTAPTPTPPPVAAVLRGAPPLDPDRNRRGLALVRQALSDPALTTAEEAS